MSWEWMWLLVVPALGIAVTLVLWIMWCPHCREITGITVPELPGRVNQRRALYSLQEVRESVVMGTDWRDVNVALPEEGVEVLCSNYEYCDPERDRYCAVLHRQGQTWYQVEEDCFTPTHWMPLPALPEDP